MIRLHSGKHEVIDDEFTITDNKSFGVHVTLEHKSDDHVLQNLAAFLKVNDFQNSGMFKLSTKIRHVDTKKQEWKVSGFPIHSKKINNHFSFDSCVQR